MRGPFLFAVPAADGPLGQTGFDNGPAAMLDAAG